MYYRGYLITASKDYQSLQIFSGTELVETVKSKKVEDAKEIIDQWLDAR